MKIRTERKAWKVMLLSDLTSLITVFCHTVTTYSLHKCNFWIYGKPKKGYSYTFDSSRCIMN